MKKIIASIALASCALTAQAREWTVEEVVWGSVAGGLLVTDWHMTRKMSRLYTKSYVVPEGSASIHPAGSVIQIEGYHEQNAILGRKPSTGKINLYFLAVIPAIYFAADYFEEYRKELLQAVTVVQGLAISNNLSLGLKL